MVGTQETTAALNITSGEALVGLYQQVTRLVVARNGYTRVLSELEDRRRALILGPGNKNFDPHAEISEERLEDIGWVSVQMFGYAQLSESIDKATHDLKMARDDVINDSLLGSLVLVREVEPNSRAIKESRRSWWDTSMTRRGSVSEATARIGSTWYTKDTLGLYIPGRMGTGHKAEYEVTVVDENANPQVEIEFV